MTQTPHQHDNFMVPGRFPFPFFLVPGEISWFLMVFDGSRLVSKVEGKKIEKR